MRKDHNALKLVLLLLALTSLACNAFAGSLEPLPDPPQISERPSSTTQPPEMAATATLPVESPTSEAAVLMLVDLNVRSGPGVRYERIGFLAEGTTVPVIGVDPSSGWWKIPCPESISGDHCWVSGGQQYVKAAYAENVPTAEAPATPTTLAPTIEAGRGWIAYLDNGQLHVAGLDLSQGPPALVTEGQPISADSTVLRFAFSPDGRRLAYVAGDQSENTLFVVNVDGSDSRQLATSSALPVEPDQDTAPQTNLIDNIQWLPQGNAVAFNTVVSNLIGLGGGSREDLWIVTLDGELEEILTAGEGGGLFLILPGGRLILSGSREIKQAMLDGSGQETILTFDPINTASEYIYYPPLQTTGSGVHIAIPAGDPWAPNAATTLWRLPQDGSAAELGSVTGVPLDHPIIWSSNGQQIAAVQRTDNSDQVLLRLLIAAGDGSDAIPYAGGSNLAFLSWSPGGDLFLYGGRGYYAQGRQQAPQQQTLLPAGQIAAEAEWLDADNYMISLYDPASRRWEIRSVNTDGNSVDLLFGQGMQSAYELWVP